MSKSKLNKLKQIDGKLDKPAKTRPQTIDELLGITTGKYTTSNAEEYADYLNDLNKSDLQRHAVDVGLTPVDDRLKLTGRLISQFNKHIASFKPIPQKKKKQVSDSLKKIVSEGF